MSIICLFFEELLLNDRVYAAVIYAFASLLPTLIEVLYHFMYVFRFLSFSKICRVSLNLVVELSK